MCALVRRRQCVLAVLRLLLRAFHEVPGDLGIGPCVFDDLIVVDAEDRHSHLHPVRFSVLGSVDDFDLFVNGRP
ncbi:hypothetical protein BJF84_05610 [Rhodococcus sp. CUA-806]|nr:hypothetical protein BJF84_05610 [Rhodococcus sp. CUA-806]